MRWMQAGSGTRLLSAVSGLFALSAVATTAVTVNADHTTTIREVQQRNTVLTEVLEEHARRSFDISKASLLELERVLMASGEPVMTPNVVARMNDWIKDIPQIASFWLIAADGRVLFTTQDVATTGVDYSDREYFRAHREGVDLHVGQMTRGRIDQIWFFSLSKRLTDRDGKFVGVLLASMRTDYFTALYNRLGVGPNDNLAIDRTDGATIVRRLATPKGEVGPASFSHPLFTEYFPKSATGLFEAVSPIDHVNRLGAYRGVEGWPLIAVSTSDKDKVLAPWRWRAWRSTAYCTVVLIGLGFLTWWGYRRISGEMRALEETAAMAEALKTASASKSRFFAAASHDLRQPFQAMRTNYELLDLKMTDTQQRPTLARLGDLMNSTEKFLDELLDVAKLDSGGISAKREMVSPGRIVRNLVAELAPVAANKGLKLRAFSCDDAMVDTDPFLLRRVLFNLLTNAIHYTEIGGVLVGMRRRGGVMAIEVWDTGIGIAPEVQESVFEEFYRVANKADSRQKGSGLGLAIVRRLCGLLHCEVSLASRPGRGSVFRVMVPLVFSPSGEARLPPTREFMRSD